MNAALPIVPQLPGLAQLPDWLAQIVAHHEALKIRFATYVGISDWELHTHLGMLIFVAVAIVFRRSMASPWPMLVAIGVECLNEYFDKLAYASWRWEDTSRDFLFTLLWPILLFLLVRSGLVRGR
jgi:hypothetical protein